MRTFGSVPAAGPARHPMRELYDLGIAVERPRLTMLSCGVRLPVERQCVRRAWRLCQCRAAVSVASKARRLALASQCEYVLDSSLRAIAALPGGRYMRLLALALSMAVATISVSAAPAAPTADRDVAKITRAGLVQLHSVIGAMNACRGCPDRAGKVQAVSLRWMNELYWVPSSTRRGRSGLHAAIEAFRSYRNAANSASLSYAEYRTHPGVSPHLRRLPPAVQASTGIRDASRSLDAHSHPDHSVTHRRRSEPHLPSDRLVVSRAGDRRFAFRCSSRGTLKEAPIR